MKTLLTLFAFSILSINAYAKDMSSSTLDEYIRQRDNSPIEGNISIPSSKWKMNVFRSLMHKNSAIKSIGEIGFNAGHSSENFLLANPTCKVISFDIMTHTYTKIGKKYIDISYPGRHTLIGGDSAITVKKFSARKGHPLFD